MKWGTPHAIVKAVPREIGLNRCVGELVVLSPLWIFILFCVHVCECVFCRRVLFIRSVRYLGLNSIDSARLYFRSGLGRVCQCRRALLIKTANYFVAVIRSISENSVGGVLFADGPARDLRPLSLTN